MTTQFDQEENTTEVLPTISTDSVEPTGPIKKPKKPLFIAAICIVAVLAITTGALAATGTLQNFIKKNFSTPEEYYEYVETKGRDQASSALTSVYDQTYQLYGSSKTANQFSCKLVAEPTLQTMIATLPFNFSGLETAEIKGSNKMEDDTVSNQIQLLLNDKNILTMNHYMDYKNKEQYIQIPEINKAYLDNSFYFKELTEDPSTGQLFGMLEDIQQYLPKTAAVQTLFDRYTAVFIQEHGKVTKTTEKLSLEEISKEYTKLTVEYDSKNIAAMLQKLVSTAQEDQELKEILSNISPDLYENFNSTIKEITPQLDSVAEELGDSHITMDVYVNSKSEVIGRTLTFSGNPEDTEDFVENDEIILSYLLLQDNADFQYSLTGTLNKEELVNFTGSGTIKNNVMNGNFKLGVHIEDESISKYIADPSDLIDIKVEDYDMNKADNGYACGTFTFSSKNIPAIANYALALQMDGKKESFSTNVTVLCNNDPLLTAQIKSEITKDAPNTKPADDATFITMSDDSDDTLMSYFESFDPYTFFSEALKKAGINADLSYLRDLYSGYSLGSDSDYDDSYYDDSNYDDSDYDDSYYDDSDSLYGF